MSGAGGSGNRADDGAETGDLFESDGGPRWNSPTARFDARVGVLLLSFVLAALFVLPDHPLVLVPGDRVPVGVRDGVGNGAFVTIAVASAVAGTAVGGASVTPPSARPVRL